MVAELETLLGWKSLAVGLWVLAFFVAERLLPAARPLPAPGDNRKPAGGWWRLGRNLGLWLLNAALSPLLILPLTFWAATHALSWRPDWWQGLPGLALDILLLDLLIYWWHRANHEVPFLWRFHEVHHLDRFLDTTSALRFHFGEVVLSALARAAVVLLLGFPFTSVLVFEVLVLLGAIFHHSNLRLPATLEQVLARLIITPSIHWVHHHALRRDTDSNYGTLFSFWDRLFGSRSAQPRDLAMPIGVEGRAEEGFVSLLVHPLRAAPAVLPSAKSRSPD
ncbi:sterol desaturase family protein [Pelagibius litoralis]|uniref:Sterol desaturase family protein n=1 Tax=Pelagibius litoralis TaxID=374515 RepID=A0A967F0V1_9PROT|nr:sterol desaturase family protein [Pelagibius litoralis]NIA71002.1 sterol desaturase family protein [Pelagibius litoralis]